MKTSQVLGLMAATIYASGMRHRPSWDATRQTAEEWAVERAEAILAIAERAAEKWVDS